jgi:hypothetical protein
MPRVNLTVALPMMQDRWLALRDPGAGDRILGCRWRARVARDPGVVARVAKSRSQPGSRRLNAGRQSGADPAVGRVDNCRRLRVHPFDLQSTGSSLFLSLARSNTAVMPQVPDAAHKIAEVQSACGFWRLFFTRQSPPAIASKNRHRSRGQRSNPQWRIAEVSGRRVDSSNHCIMRGSPYAASDNKASPVHLILAAHAARWADRPSQLPEPLLHLLENGVVIGLLFRCAGQIGHADRF